MNQKSKIIGLDQIYKIGKLNLNNHLDKVDFTIFEQFLSSQFTWNQKQGMIVERQQDLQELESKSRKVLTQLLDQQITKNEVLSKQNVQLEQQQRKLVAVLEAKSEEVYLLANKVQQLQEGLDALQETVREKQEQLQRAYQVIRKLQQQALQQQNVTSNHKQTNNDTTLQQTILLGRSKLRQFSLTAQTERERRSQKRQQIPQQYNRGMQERQKQILVLRGQLAQRVRQLEQLQQTSLRQRQYYQKAIQSMEQKAADEQSQLKIRIEQLERRLKQTQTQSSEFSSKNRQNYEEMTKRILELEEKEHELNMLEKILQDKEDKIKILRNNENKLIEQLTLNEEKINQLHSQHQKDKKAEVDIYEKEIKMLQKAVEQQASRHTKQLQNTRESILEQTKQCLIQELEKEKKLSKQALASTENQLVNTKKLYKQALEKNEQQLELIIKMEDRVKVLETSQQQRSEELAQTENIKMQLEKSIQKISKQSGEYKKLSEELSSQLKHRQSQISELKHTLVNAETARQSQTEKLQQKYAKLKQQHQSLNKSYNALDEDYKNLLVAEETAQLEIEKLQQKMAKQQSRKEKLLTEYKNTFEEFKAENETLTEKNHQLEISLEQAQNSKEQVEKKMTKQLHSAKEKSNYLLKQNTAIKEQVKSIETKMKTLINSYESKITQSEHELETISKTLKQLALEKEHFKKVNEELRQTNTETKHQNQELEQKNQQLKSTLSNCEEQVQMLRQELVNLQLSSCQKGELERLRNEHYENRAKLNYAQETIAKYKQQNQDLTKDLISLNEASVRQKLQIEKHQKQQKTLRQEMANLSTKNKQLERSLKDRCTELDKSMPYLNQVIQEKKMMENELQKLNAEVKKREGLLEVAKRTKADQIVMMRQQITALSKRLKESEQSSVQAKQLIEKYNRQKVNILRESTSRGDQIKKLERENGLMKQELIKMKKIQNELQEQLTNFYNIMENQQQSLEDSEDN